MIINEIKLVKINNKNKYKIYIDFEYYFTLYYSELRKYKIKVNSEISEELIGIIYRETIIPRCKNKAILCLKYADQSIFTIRRKLYMAGYTDYAIDETIKYLKEYNFVDDYRYAKLYVDSRISYKSIIILKSELKNKGISNEIIGDIFMEIEYNEEECLHKLINKKINGVHKIDEKTYKKTYGYFVRKGYSSRTICNILKEYY